MYQIAVSTSSAKFLKGLPADYKDAIKAQLKLLEMDIFPRNAIRLKGRESCYRIRVGPFRIQYSVLEKEKTVLIYKISRRDETTYA